MPVLIFLVILAILVVAHEFGHFVVAKLSGMKVKEFAIGFPPRLWSIQWGETRYSINAIPFGGYVKILGEDGIDPDLTPADANRSFGSRPRILQALVLVAGVSANIIVAWLMISFGFMIGLPTSQGSASGGQLINPRVTVLQVLPDSPALKAGFKEGDSIVSLSAGNDTEAPASVQDVQDFISIHGANPISVTLSRGSQTVVDILKPAEGIVEGKYAIGIAMDVVGKWRLPFFSALGQGAKLTVSLISETITGLYGFFKQAVTFHADFSQVSGPVGIVSAVGDVSALGFVYLLSFAAYISINLAVLNLVPFPALDGGRLLFVIIESIKRSPIKPKVANIVNTVGFSILILLMIAVTVHDLFRIF